MDIAIKEVVWIANLLRELESLKTSQLLSFVFPRLPYTLQKNAVFHEMTNHVKLDCYQVRDRIANGFMETLHVGGCTFLYSDESG